MENNLDLFICTVRNNEEANKTQNLLVKYINISESPQTLNLRQYHNNDYENKRLLDLTHPVEAVSTMEVVPTMNAVSTNESSMTVFVGRPCLHNYYRTINVISRQSR